MTRFGSLLLVAGAATLVACGTPMDTGDGGMNGDASMSGDGGGMGGDGGGMTGPGVCDATQIVDLSMRGMRMGTRTTYTGTTAMARGTQQITPPADCVGSGRVIRQVAHTYRTTTAGYLRASTDAMATPQGMTGAHDTVLWMQNTCDTRGTMSYGCNDDAAGLRSTVVSSQVLPAGTMVTIIVGTLAEADNAAGLPYGLVLEELTPLAAGAACDPTEQDLCAPNHTCVGNGQVGTCVPNGTRARTRCRTGNMCDAGLSCVETDAGGYCYRTAMANGPCNFEESQCPDGTQCLPNSATDLYTGVCRADGTRGGLCDAMTACMMGTTCSSMDENAGTCRTAAMAGGACDPLGYETQCPMGNACIPGAMSPTMTVCTAPGTAAGAPCRETGERCDMGLTCTAAMGPGRCVRDGMMGGACDPQYGTVKCAGTEVCRATAPTMGTCAAPVMEPTSDNNSPMMAGSPVATPAAIRGSIAMPTDIDCYTVTVPAAGGSIFASVNDAAGGCGTATFTNMGMTQTVSADTQLFLLDAMGRTIDVNDDTFRSVCSQIDGTNAASPAHNLPGGNYVLCVRSYEGQLAIPEYVLNVNVSPRM